MPKRNPIANVDMSRRNVLIGGAGMAATTGLSMAAFAAETKPPSTPAPHGNNQGKHHMSTITTNWS